MPKVNIIIVNWNTGELLASCLRSIQALPEKDVIGSVTIVDNNSHDSSVAKAKEVIDGSIDIEIIESEENLGFAKANNLAIRKAKKGNHVLLLNPDTEVKPGAVVEMVDVLNKEKNVGVVGAQLFNSNGTIQPSVRSFPTLSVVLFLVLKLQRFFSACKFWRKYMMVDFDYSLQSEVDQIMGAVFLIRDVVIERVGLLDEAFWIWFEEVDYCKRVKKAGWSVVYAPKAKVVHFGGVSFNQLIGLKRVLPWLKSLLIYSFKNLGFVSGVIVLLTLPIGILLALPASLYHLSKGQK